MNKCITSYYCDGKPSNGLHKGANAGRRTAFGYFEGKQGERMQAVMSFPAHLNNRNLPDLKEIASILRGDSVEAAMAQFNKEAIAAEYVESQQQPERKTVAYRITQANPDDVAATYSALRMAAASVKYDKAGRNQFVFDDGSVAVFDGHFFRWVEQKPE